MRRAATLLVLAAVLLVPRSASTDGVGEKLLLDNDRVAVYEYVFPAGFRGDEHAAVGNNHDLADGAHGRGLGSTGTRPRPQTAQGRAAEPR